MFLIFYICVFIQSNAQIKFLNLSHGFGSCHKFDQIYSDFDNLIMKLEKNES